MIPEQQAAKKRVLITAEQQAKIRLLSDYELYPQAVQFMRNIARPLPSTQINGLLNVSLGSTYDQLLLFVEHQRDRTTWRNNEQHIPMFYRGLRQKLQALEDYLPSLYKLRAEKPLPEEVQALKMALAREFIQHLLAENGYMVTTKAANDTRKPE